MKILNTRLQQKHDIAANWEKTNLVPLAGEIIVYDDRYLDADRQEVIVATAVRYKIGDGVTSVNKLPFADAVDVTRKVKELGWRLDDLESNALAGLTPVDGTIQITKATDGNTGISVAIAAIEGNALTAVEGGLFVPVSTSHYEAGTGIEITENKVKVKLAEVSHGLVAVDGALTINLATQETDGAMSKEDKALLDSMSEELEDIYDAIEALNNSSTWSEFTK